MKERIYYVKGIHCASCEVLIEKKLLEIGNIHSVEAKAGKGEIIIEYEGQAPEPKYLNKIFKRENYIFSDITFKKENTAISQNDISFVIVVSALIIGAFIFLNKLGFSGLINVGAKSSLPVFFVFGLIAGLSSCAALVGGIVLSMSKQWQDLYSHEKAPLLQKLQPQIMFNFGRVAFYALGGFILGLFGEKIKVSFGTSAFLIIGVSVLMLFLGLQMIGVKTFRKFQFTLPKFFTRFIADERNFQSRYMPFLMGAFTFFLPCGFTITAQGLALISGNPLQGGLIMLAFALGTAPVLLAIGLSSAKFSDKPNLSFRFSKIAAVVVMFFAFFNINNQLNVLGTPSLADIIPAIQSGNSGSDSMAGRQKEGLPPIVNGKQIIKMEATSYGYQPNYFKVKAGTAVRWEIKDVGTSGCTNAVISKGLFSDEINLTPGETSVKEFIPEKPGKYKFSCWMGMISGIIEVISDNNTASGASPPVPVANASSDSADGQIIPSGAKGCGCGGGGSGGGCSIR